MQQRRLIPQGYFLTEPSSTPYFQDIRKTRETGVVLRLMSILEECNETFIGKSLQSFRAYPMRSPSHLLVLVTNLVMF